MHAIFKGLSAPLANTTLEAPNLRIMLRRGTKAAPIAVFAGWIRSMSTQAHAPIYFGPFEVTTQVFLTTPHCFGLVNLKPVLPGHVLVCPLRPYKRLTDLSSPELTDLFQTVQRVQRMLARKYFAESSPDTPPTPEAGSFNITVQDGAEAGQTVPHVHVHILPRVRGPGSENPTDEVYIKMASEDGNVGGALWDRRHNLEERPKPGGGLPAIEDADRHPRALEVMIKEAEMFRKLLEDMDE